MTRPCAMLLGIALAACPRATPATVSPESPPAAASPAPPPDAAPIAVPLDEDLPRLAARAVELYEEIARAFAAAGADCSAATTEVRALQPAYADVVAANAKVLHGGRAKALRAALEPYATRFDAAARAIAGSATMAECAGDREFTGAFDALVAAP